MGQFIKKTRMFRRFIVGFLVFATHGTGFARIGDTEEQAKERYSGWPEFKICEKDHKWVFCEHETEKDSYDFLLKFKNGVCYFIGISRGVWGVSPDEAEIFIKKSFSWTNQISKPPYLIYFGEGDLTAIYDCKKFNLVIVDSKINKEANEAEMNQRIQSTENNLKDKF